MWWYERVARTQRYEPAKKTWRNRIPHKLEPFCTSRKQNYPPSHYILSNIENIQIFIILFNYDELKIWSVEKCADQMKFIKIQSYHFHKLISIHTHTRVPYGFYKPRIFKQKSHTSLTKSSLPHRRVLLAERIWRLLGCLLDLIP